MRYNRYMKIPEIVKEISAVIRKRGGRAIIVGGAVRDALLHIPSKDYDIEVYGFSSLLELEKILSSFGSVNLVGKSFGVLKFVYEKEIYDFSFPRFEKKRGKGHRDFEVVTDGTLSFKEASRRRDFTMNAMGYEIETGTFLDPYHGRRDMKEKRLRHIEGKTFIEDPLRVYRAVQFSARFDYRLVEETQVLCKEMVEKGMLEALPKERVYEEIKKMLLKAEHPSIGFESMYQLGITSRYFPELHALRGIPQELKWHLEGDVWVHTMLALDKMSELLRVKSKESSIGEKQKLKLLFAVLCHDFGKVSTTTLELENGEILSWDEYQKREFLDKKMINKSYTVRRIRAIGHEQAGLVPTERFLYRLMNEHSFIKAVLPLVSEHMKPLQLYAQGAKSGAIRRLAMKVIIEELVCVAKADFLGRATEEAKKGVYLAGEWLLQKAKALKVEKKPLEPLVKGRDLIALGMQPSALFKKILDEVYCCQLEGKCKTKEEALDYIGKNYTLSPSK